LREHEVRLTGTLPFYIRSCIVVISAALSSACKRMGDVLRGILFSLGGNIAISVGDHLKVYGNQGRRRHGKKLRHGKTISRDQVHKKRRLVLGVLGYVVMIAGQISNGYALAYAPQTLLACIGSIQFIMNLVCAAILMGRPITWMNMVGTLSIIGGGLLMIFGFSPRTDQSQLSVETLFLNFSSVHYRNYLMVVVLVLLASLIWQWFEAKYIHQSHGKSLSSPRPHPHSPRSHSQCLELSLISGFFYSFSSAMTGTQSVVLGKTLSLVIRGYLAGKIVIFDPLDLSILAFVVIVCFSFLVTFAFWLYRRTESMVLFDPVFIAPLNQVMWLTFTTVAGGIYFREFENATATQWASFLSGMTLNYLGLYHLMPTKAEETNVTINMEKPLHQKVDDMEIMEYTALPTNAPPSSSGKNTDSAELPRSKRRCTPVDFSLDLYCVSLKLSVAKYAAFSRRCYVMYHGMRKAKTAKGPLENECVQPPPVDCINI